MQVHKDKNNHSTSWLIALGDFTGGRLWLEDPLGQHPPPCVTSEWQKGLRGSYHNVHNTWFKFDPTKYHAVEQVKSGTRTSVALFSPRSWKRIPPHALTELADVGFHPPITAMRAEVPEPEVLDGEAEDEDIWMDAPPADQQQRFTNSPPEEEAILQEWCSQDHVSLPTDTLNVSDGSIKPLSPQEEKELREHITSGHVKKSNLCKGCLLSEGPRKLHKRVRDVDKATHVMHIDIAGPYIESHEGHHYFLVGALRLPDRPLLIDVRLLKTRTSVEVCAALERMTSFFESLSFEGFEITDSPRIKRLHSDRAREFTALYFQKFLSNHRSIYHTLTTGYDPQANGTAERSVGLMKALSARCLTTSGLPQEFWSYAVKYAAQSLLCSALQKKQKSPPFGSQVIAQVLNHKKVKYPEQRSISGRLLYWDHLQDQLSYLLCPHEEDGQELPCREQHYLCLLHQRHRNPRPSLVHLSRMRIQVTPLISTWTTWWLRMRSMMRKRKMMLTSI